MVEAHKSTKAQAQLFEKGLSSSSNFQALAWLRLVCLGLEHFERYLNKQQPDAMNKKYWIEEGWGAAARLLLLSKSTHPFAQGFSSGFDCFLNVSKTKQSDGAEIFLQS